MAEDRDLTEPPFEVPDEAEVWAGAQRLLEAFGEETVGAVLQDLIDHVIKQRDYAEAIHLNAVRNAVAMILAGNGSATKQ